MIGENVNVRVEYTGMLDDGTIFDSSEKSGAIEYLTGSDQIIEGLDLAIQRMDVGETRVVNIPARYAYGEYDERNIQKRDLRYVPNSDQLPVGRTIYFFGPELQRIPAKVLKIEDGYVYLDFNHELAGKNLTYEVTVTKVLPPKTRHVPLSSYGPLSRTVTTTPLKEELVFNNSLGSLGIKPGDIVEAAKRRESEASSTSEESHR
ncbi:MAG: peptidylprolyl isomerase [Eggerthellaceae bacterium]|jgi:FKBP-type peptidyl-prolyl cis-trans isomerase 2